MTGGAILLSGMLAVALRAQTLAIYSEFQRVDPFGNIVAADRAEHPREILSPAVARNGFASFHIVVSVPPATNYFLYVMTNPLNACRVALYKEHFAKTAGGWIPDALAEVRRLPDFGAMPDPDQSIPGQNTRVYLLDLWIPPDADVARFRLEVQLKVGFFLVKPMEVRVLTARVPDVTGAPNLHTPASLPPVELSADAAAAVALAAYIASDRELPDIHPQTVRAIIRRNAIQDMALAGLLDRNRAGPKAMQDLRDRAPRSAGAEWYLRVRDLVYVGSQQP
jgi:hypothetical protein